MALVSVQNGASCLFWMISGLELCQSMLFLSFIPSPRIQTWRSKLQGWVLPWSKHFTCHCQQKHISNLFSWNKQWMFSGPHNSMTLGHTSGEGRSFPVHGHIGSSLAQRGCTQSLNGFGNLHVSTKHKVFFLASGTRQAQHEKHIDKKKYVPGILCLCSLWQFSRRGSGSSIPTTLWFRQSMLELAWPGCPPKPRTFLDFGVF